jgi:thiamine biosynthesis protein ThiS
MHITLNGKPHILEARTSITKLMTDLQIDSSKVAIEQNLVIIPANEYAETFICDGDTLEVVQFIGGG